MLISTVTGTTAVAIATTKKINTTAITAEALAGSRRAHRTARPADRFSGPRLDQIIGRLNNRLVWQFTDPWQFLPLPMAAYYN
jgi:hypothetical protein